MHIKNQNLKIAVIRLLSGFPVLLTSLIAHVRTTPSIFTCPFQGKFTIASLMGLEHLSPKDYYPFRLYLESLQNDPVRIAILASHIFVEEILEKIIADAVPNSACFNVPKMGFADKAKIVRRLLENQDGFFPMIHALNDLRAAAAHKDYVQAA